MPLIATDCVLIGKLIEGLVLLGLAKQIATFWALKFAPNGRAEMIDNRTRENFNAGACSDGLCGALIASLIS